MLLYTLIGSAMIGSLIGQGSTWIFEAAAYRLDDTDPFIVRALHDVGFFTLILRGGLRSPSGVSRSLSRFSRTLEACRIFRAGRHI